MIRQRLLAFALALLTTSAYADSVATLDEMSGDVKINQGSQFVEARLGQEVNARDRIMAMERADASIRYHDGCELDIHAGTLVTVPATSPCKGGVPLVQQLAPANAGAVGSVTVATDPLPGIIDWDWIGTGVIIACLIWCNGDGESNGNTVSP